MVANQHAALAFPQPPGSGTPLGMFADTYAMNTPIQFTEDVSQLPAPIDVSAFTWYWTFGDGQQATGYAVSHAFAQPGTYTIHVSIRSNQNPHAAPSEFDSAQMTVVAHVFDQLPTAVAHSSARYVQVGQSVTYSATNGYAPAGGAVSYLWNFGDNTTASGATVTHTFYQIGNGYVALVVRDRRGAQSYTTVPVTVVTQLPVARIHASTTSVAVGSTIMLDASASTAPTDRPGNRIVSYAWDFGDGTQTTTTEPIVRHSYTQPGTYTVTMQATDRQDLPGMATITITVSPPFGVQLLWWLSIVLIAGSAVVLVVQLVRARKHNLAE